MLLNQSSQSCSALTINPAGYPEKISACTNNGTDVRIALLTQLGNGKFVEDAAPNDNNGAWTGICIMFPTDADAPNLTDPRTMVQFYRHNFPAGNLALQYTLDLTDQLDSAAWNSSFLRATAGGGVDRLSVSSRLGGLLRYELGLSTGAVYPVGLPFTGEAFSAQDNVASISNPGVVLFQQEFVGAVSTPAQMVYVDPVAPYGITTVPQTTSSPCPNGYPLPGTCPADPSKPYSLRGPIEPQLYEGNLLDEAHWVDPTDPNYEFFLPGRKIWERYDMTTCAPIVDCDPGYVTPCDAAGNPTWGLQRPLQPGDYLSGTWTGWRLTRLRVGSGMPASGPAMEPHSWVFKDPVTSPTSKIPGELYTQTDDRTQSIADPRMTPSGYPTAVYFTRSGSSHGVTAVQCEDLVRHARSTQQAPFAVCIGTPTAIGTGESLAAALDYRSTLTHQELEWRRLPFSTVHNDCNPIANCSGTLVGAPRVLMDDHTAEYMTWDSTGSQKWILAIASGFVASAGSPPDQSATCAWGQYASRPMLTLVDVTSTGDGVTFASPQVLRIALGNGVGNAFAVRTKTIGRNTFAFVGDLTGKLMVFDVSGTKLFPAPPFPYVNPPGTPPFLPLLAEINFPEDPYDRIRANCIDIECVGEFLYCALSRNGVGIVDIHHPASPVLVDVMDTPGLVLGCSTRTVSSGSGTATQLIVGDAHCGVRIYQ